jgi:hypothetical protein
MSIERYSGDRLRPNFVDRRNTLPDTELYHIRLCCASVNCTVSQLYECTVFELEPYFGR